MGWTIRTTARRRPLPPAVDARYPAIPADVRAFLEGLESAASRDESVWFITADDYGRDDDDIAWDFMETWGREGLAAEALAEQRAFWDAHLPIALSAAGDYAFVAVRVDPAGPRHGEVVMGEPLDVPETTVLAPSLSDLLTRIAAMPNDQEGWPLDHLFGDPHDPRRLVSPPVRNPVTRLAHRLRAWPLFERYRIGVAWEPEFSRPLWAWEAWSQIMRPLAAVIAGLKAEAVIRPRQAGDHDNWLTFGRLPWSEKNNRTWTTRYLADPALAGRVTFFANEIWAPSHAVAFETRRGPELFCLVDRNQAGGGQGFVLALRKDVLPPVAVAADETLFAARSQLGDHKCEVFERTWGEHGRFGALVVDNPLDYTSSETVLKWARAHPKTRARSFRWKP